MSTQPRPLNVDEIDAVTALWHDTWHGSHDHIAPQVLCEFRTRDYFRRRIHNERETVRVLGPPGKPIGLCMVSNANLDMLFVSPLERSKGVGERLLADAETRMRGGGVKEAYLYVAIGNDGAVRFYERHGWTKAGKVNKVFDVADGTITHKVHKMLKDL
jgi:ribosomal protein S18 acetylase RimI-like enzyme